ncbi:putative aldouronate transport system substrate-binding protein [Paenibacillus catalpae]|uniref:Putative aldouronate transport system substrate-binding protein n=1 Tax=Paenibacillus catalpae TaxID=1045775 RepID=A0A1I2BHG4_9BACL|nr:sugar ABC transporter substrate-binding protein [Paenibacillus catalpae]SFE55601.1 putative aldouronate transport system substrate-binding protein [Paenibacillus catalpae]
MKRFSRRMGMILSVIMIMFVVAACSGNNGNSGGNNKPAESNAASNDATQSEKPAEDYAFGEDVTFHSNEPVTYSMMYSDHEGYPYKEDWRFWSAIKEKTNVSFDLAITARTEYENQKSLLVNSGDAPYIIPKTYEEAAFVAGGQIVPISDYVQYMPNFQKAVKNWGMEEDLKVKLQADGKYYVLPGLWESPGGGYSYIIRKDIFEKAGVDLSKQTSWTYEDFYEAMKKVKEFTGKKYVLSDTSKGESTLNIAAVEYGVTAGWGKANGMRFNQDTKQFEFADNTQDYKDFVTYFNKLITEGIMDPESFTQEDDAAKSKFFKGDSFVVNGNYQLLADYQTKMEDPNAELYMITQPGGPKGQLQVETSRLENGVMISQNALKDLGEEEFIKMLRFVDWLWYSEEGQTLSLWGVEGETYSKDASGKITLNSDISYNGMNPTATKKLNVDYGFGSGMFAYGGSSNLRMSKMTEGEKDFVSRVLNDRTPRKLAPPIMANPDESEQLNLISKPLMDYVNTMTLKFITGQEKLENWDKYVEQVKANGSDRYTQMANEIFEKTKSTLGY